jgi:hypothetical protein
MAVLAPLIATIVKRTAAIRRIMAVLALLIATIVKIIATITRLHTVCTIKSLSYI